MIRALHPTPDPEALRRDYEALLREPEREQRAGNGVIVFCWIAAAVIALAVASAIVWRVV